MTLETINSLALSLGLSSDWSIGRPPWIDGRAHAIDQDIARESICGTCGSIGLEHVSFFRTDCTECEQQPQPHQHQRQRPERREYRCFARCPECEASEEY